jgi:hypothetical protein
MSLCLTFFTCKTEQQSERAICIQNSLKMEVNQIFIDRWIDKKTWHACIMGYSSASKRKEILTWFNMDESWGHYGKWNKLVTKGKTLWFHLQEESRVTKFLKTESRKTQSCGNEEQAVCSTGSVWILQDERLSGDGADSCTMMWLYLRLLNCTITSGYAYFITTLKTKTKKQNNNNNFFTFFCSVN